MPIFQRRKLRPRESSDLSPTLGFTCSARCGGAPGGGWLGGRLPEPHFPAPRLPLCSLSLTPLSVCLYLALNFYFILTQLCFMDLAEAGQQPEPRPECSQQPSSNRAQQHLGPRAWAEGAAERPRGEAWEASWGLQQGRQEATGLLTPESGSLPATPTREPEGVPPPPTAHPLTTSTASRFCLTRGSERAPLGLSEPHGASCSGPLTPTHALTRLRPHGLASRRRPGVPGPLRLSKPSSTTFKLLSILSLAGSLGLCAPPRGISGPVLSAAPGTPFTGASVAPSKRLMLQ